MTTFKEHVRLKEYTRGTVEFEQAFEDKILYVRPGGSDYNNGSEDNDDKAFATLKGAFDYLKLWKGNGFDCYIYVADGTYSDTGVINDVSGWLNIYIEGNNTNPENCILQSATRFTGVIKFEDCSSKIFISGFTFKGLDDFVYGLDVSRCAFVLVDAAAGDSKCIFERCDQPINVAYSYVEVRLTSMEVKVRTFYALVGGYGAGCFIGFWPDELIIASGCTVGGSASWMGIFAARGGSVIDEYIGTLTNNGSFTGPRWMVFNFGSVNLRAETATALQAGGGLPQQSASNLSIGLFSNTAVIVPNKTVAQLSTFVPPGAFTYCTNESGGATLVFFDGTNWRRVSDRAIVS